MSRRSRAREIRPKEPKAFSLGKRIFQGFVWILSILGIGSVVGFLTEYQKFKVPLNIEGGQLLLSRDIMSQEFQIKNLWLLSLREIDMTCSMSISRPDGTPIFSRIVMRRGDIIPELKPDEPTTRDCAAYMPDLKNVNVNLTLTLQFVRSPAVLGSGKQEVIFGSKIDPDGVVHLLRKSQSEAK